MIRGAGANSAWSRSFAIASIRFPKSYLIRPMPYTEAQRLVDNAVPIGNRYYWKSSFTRNVSSDLASVCIVPPLPRLRLDR